MEKNLTAKEMIKDVESILTPVKYIFTSKTLLMKFLNQYSKEQRIICKNEFTNKVLLNNDYTKELTKLTIVHAPQPDIFGEGGRMTKEIKSPYGDAKSMTDKIFIPYNVPSLKNGKQLFKNKHTGKYFIASSDPAQRYKHLACIYYRENKDKFKDMIYGLRFPLNIEFKFVRERKSRFDFINMAQIVCDMMVDYGWLPDDSYQYLVPYFNPIVRFDKDNPGVIITIKNNHK